MKKQNLDSNFDVKSNSNRSNIDVATLNFYWCGENEYQEKFDKKFLHVCYLSQDQTLKNFFF